MKKFIPLLSLIAFSSFGAFSQTYPTKALSKSFTELQLHDLSEVLNYMDSLVLQHHAKLGTPKAYHAFFDSLRVNFIEQENANGQLAIDEVVKYDFLQGLDSTTFNAIWIKDSPLMVRTKDTIIRNPSDFYYLRINNMGKVMDYLKLLGKKSPYFKAAHEYIEVSGAIGPSLFAGMFYKHDNLDFNNLDDRLWAAIFYLTIEESNEKKIDRYYK